MQTFSQYGRWLPIYICWIAGIILGGGAARPCRAQEPSEQRGILYLHGGGYVSDSQREQFTELAGGAKAKIVIIPTADVSTPLDPVRIHDWQRTRPADVQLLHAENRQQAERSEFSRILDDATGVWFSGGKQGYLVGMYENTPVLDRVRKLLSRGGVVGGTSAGAAIASTPMLIFDRMVQGFEFLPGTIVDQHFLAKDRLGRLMTALESFPSYVGLGIDEQTVLVVRGNRLEVSGESKVMVCLGKTSKHPQQVISLSDGESEDLIKLKQFAKQRQ